MTLMLLAVILMTLMMLAVILMTLMLLAVILLDDPDAVSYYLT